MKLSLNPRKLAFLSTFATLCLVIQLTPRPPNVEFTSFFTFIVGLTYGVLVGSFFGCFVMFFNGFLSPYGFAGFNMPFQMIGMAIPGIVGGIYRGQMPERFDSTSFCVETSVLGALSALVFDLVTNVGVALWYVISGIDSALAMLTAIAYGTFFSIVHIVSSAAVFGVLALPSMKILDSLMEVRKNV